MRTYLDEEHDAGNLIAFTDKEIAMLKFSVKADLETVTNAVQNEGQSEWQEDAQLLESILTKLERL